MVLLNFDGPGEVVLGRIGKLAKTFDDRVFGLGGGGGLFVLEVGEALQYRLERLSIGDMCVVSDRDEMPSSADMEPGCETTPTPTLKTPPLNFRQHHDNRCNRW